MPNTPGNADAAARLLLIDGDPTGSAALCSDFVRCLSQQPIIAVAQTGRSAMELLRGGPFDLVLIDLSTLSDLASSTEQAVVRLVKLADGALMVGFSSDASISAAVAMMRAGVHDVVALPVESSALTARLTRLAQRHGRGALLGAEIPAEIAADLSSLTEASSQIREIGDLLGWSGDVGQLQDVVRRLATTFDHGTTRGMQAARRTVEPMWRQEQRIIEDAIVSFAGNVALAAAALELSPSTIYRKRQAWAEMEASKGAA